MAKYDVFISYRKARETDADLIKKTLVEEYGFKSEKIFLDKDNIGPEHFDKRLKVALLASECIVLLVTKNCFAPKEDDWYIKEIQTALTAGKTIIPVFFDDIKSLGPEVITNELKKSFTESEISILQKYQGIPYNFDLSDATFSKLSNFIHKAKERNEKKVSKISKWIVRLSIILLFLALAYSLFLGIGFIWGYYFSSSTAEDVLCDNCRFEPNSSYFEFKGLKAEYNHVTDSITIHTETFNGDTPQSNYDVLLQACSASGSLILLEKNIANLRYIKYLKNGSKPAKFATLGIAVAAGIGSFFGFSQGSTLGRSMRQHEAVLELYPKLKDKSEWQPILKKRMESYPFSSSYLSERMKYVNESTKHNDNKDFWNSTNVVIFVEPYDSVPIAKNAGLIEMSILIKFNNWEIGNNTPSQLNDEIQTSKNQLKHVIFASADSIDIHFTEIILPQGFVGIHFCDYKEIKEIYLNQIIDDYNNWKKNRNKENENI